MIIALINVLNTSLVMTCIVGIVMGVRKVNVEPMWEIISNDKDVYVYNLSEVQEALEIWELNKDCDNDDAEDKPPPPLLHAREQKNTPKEKKKPKAKKKKKCKKRENNYSLYSHGNYDSGKPYIYHVDYCEGDKSYEYNPMDNSEENRYTANL